MPLPPDSVDKNLQQIAIPLFQAIYKCNLENEKFFFLNKEFKK